MVRTLLSAGVLTLLVTLSSPTPARAIPICQSGSMADYVGFGSTGCNVNTLTFLNFSYSGSVRAFSGISEDFFGSPIIPPPPPSAISVLPLSNVANLGSGGAALRFAPAGLPFGGYWQSVNIGFEVFARTGPGIIRNELAAGLQSVADLQSAGIGETTRPGGSLVIGQGVGCFVPIEPHFCDNPTGLSLPFTRFQDVDISGFNVRDLEAGFATPEPTTLLLFGTTAAGLGLARWRQRRRKQQQP